MDIAWTVSVGVARSVSGGVARSVSVSVDAVVVFWTPPHRISNEIGDLCGGSETRDQPVVTVCIASTGRWTAVSRD